MLIEIIFQGGGILAMSEIVVADLVPLAERGVFLGLLGLVWAISSAIGMFNIETFADKQSIDPQDKNFAYTISYYRSRYGWRTCQ